MPEYQFFVSDGSPKPANKAMRSHAMKMALRSRAAQTQDPAGSSSGQSDSQRTRDLKHALKGKFKLNPKSASKDRGEGDKLVTAEDSGKAIGLLESNTGDMQLQPAKGDLGTGSIEWFANGSVDPFGTLPVPHNSRVERILKFYLAKFAINMTTTDQERSWFTLAKTSPLIMHITLAFAATLWMSDCVEEDVVVRREGYWQKGETIRIVNEHLRKGQITDTVLAAVAKLSNVAGLEGSLQEADMHVRAVARLVGLRGGVQVLKDNLTVACMVNCADFHIATGVNRTPLMPLVYGPEELPIPQDIIKEAESPSLSHLDCLAYGAGTLKGIFLLLRQSILYRKYKTGEPDVAQIILNIAEFHVLDHLLPEHMTRHTLQFKTLLLATHTFIYSVMRHLPKKVAVMPILVGRLKTALEMRGTNPAAWDNSLPALAWALFIGATAVEKGGEDEVEWFSLRLELIFPLMGIETKEQFQGCMQQFVWTRSCSNFLDRWWGRRAPGLKRQARLITAT